VRECRTPNTPLGLCPAVFSIQIFHDLLLFVSKSSCRLESPSDAEDPDVGVRHFFADDLAPDGILLEGLLLR